MYCWDYVLCSVPAKKYKMIDLNNMERKLDEALSKETKETLNDFINNKINKMENEPKLIANEPKFLEHLLKYNVMTDNEIMEKATVNNVIDAEYALKLFAERDICKDATAYIIDELSKLKKDENK